MEIKRREEHMRNERLEELLKEVNGMLQPLESQEISKFQKNKHPLVLVMGNPRSGTTLFMQWLASLGYFAYPSNLLSRFYSAPYIGAKIQHMLTTQDMRNELYELNSDLFFYSRLGKTKGMLAPNEFWYFWRRFFKFGEIQQLSKEELEKVDIKLFMQELAAVEAVFGLPFAMKGTIVNWNIPFMVNKIEKVLFVYIRRKPFYIIQSLLNARLDFYGELKCWHSYKPPEYSFLKNMNPYEQVAGQVYFTKVAVEDGLNLVDEAKKLIIDYEDFCQWPMEIFKKIIDRFRQQEQTVNWVYNGPSSFEASESVRLTAEEVNKVKVAYRKFSGETLEI